MKIAIRADGSEKIGMGHLIRCSVLADEFLKRNHNIVFLTKNNTGGFCWLNEKYDCAGISNELIDDASFVSMWCIQNEIDILLIDSYEATEKYIAQIGDAGIKVAVLDDNHRIKCNCFMIVNGNISSDSKDYKDCRAEKILVGSRYAILRNEFNRKVLPLRTEIRNILVTMGGSDPNNYTPIVLNALKDFDNVNIKVIIGPLMTNIEEVFLSAEKCIGNVQILMNPSSMADLMIDSDLAIIAGGGTVKEVFALGLVAIIILQADNQRKLGIKLKQIGYDLCLGVYKDVSANMIEETVKRIMVTPALRRNYREKFEGLVAKDGAKRIVDEMICMNV